MPAADYTREILKKVRQIEIRTRRLVTDSLTGQYHSVFKGRGMDFDEVREYSPGDEVRTIDWNVTARTGHPFVKKFTEERELTILLLVDLSASGHFGSHRQSKREMAAELASVLAFSAIRNNDKVGLILFTDEVEKYIPPQKGRRHVLRVIREILFFNPARRGTRIARALQFMNQVTHRRAVTFLVSDFFDKNYEREIKLTARKHDLVGVAISDPNENALPNIGTLTIEDSETGEQFEVDSSNKSVRDRFQALSSERRENLRRSMLASGVDFLELSTGEPYMPVVVRFFDKRILRRK
ncbi:MAG: DUF58 domain-containing protein [Verrucomicrobiae bacterium]|nr:DUF58 domain-containing protein [Verrucomicrobiae bacterium]